MAEHYDVVIIGGGPSGSSAAYYLRKKGYNVAISEKEKFPREHVGESLIPFCHYRLMDMGLVEDVKKFATKKPGINFIDKDGGRESVWCFERILQDEAGVTFHTPRAEFDKCLLDHAAKHGAQVFEQHTVKDTQLDNKEQVTLRVADASGQEKIITGRFLLDASGQHSFLAKRMGGKKPFDGLDRVAFYRRWTNNAYDASLNAGMIKIVYLGGEKKGWIWVIPIGRNYLSIGVTLNHEYVREQKKKYTGDDWRTRIYENEIAEATCLSGILANSTAEHEAYSVSDYSYSVETKYGDNFAMIGDAGAFLDPIFSSGLFAAMETAYRVSNALDVKLRDGYEAGKKAFESTYVDIEGAYKLIEKFVRLFYDPELMKFSHTGPGDDGYEKFLSSYNVFHYLMAGDFFSHYKKYSDFIDTLNRERNYNQFITYVKSKAQEFSNKEYCRHTYEEIYGHLPLDGK